ncbi:hypothetical protein DEE69_24885 [Ralstonia insidiosa]|nr:hypothetical protein [Ralstonia insidiosa]MBA9939358.1 hypothetical protein [Ralstonia insidiosa]MBC9968128.1 hypothetical protein [Ralstonia insidiosa]MBX3904309.1 hypothetical protein [Ralstonia insidiosa]
MQAEMRDNWLTRNLGWIYPILGGLIVVVSPAAIQTIAFNGESIFPGWLRAFALVIGFISITFGGFKAYFAETLSARLFTGCLLMAGFASAIYQIALWLKS